MRLYCQAAALLCFIALPCASTVTASDLTRPADALLILNGSDPVDVITTTYIGHVCEKGFEITSYDNRKRIARGRAFDKYFTMVVTRTLAGLPVPGIVAEYYDESSWINPDNEFEYNGFYTIEAIEVGF